MSNGLNPAQDRHTGGPDLGPSCLQRLSADDKSHRQQGKNSVIILKICCAEKTTTEA